jgi:sugar phosphate isomerase/epimerase
MQIKNEYEVLFMLKIGLSSCGKTLNDELFRAYKEAGIECMEISVDLETGDNLNWPELFALSQKYGVELWSYHLPFCPFDKIDVSSPNEELRQKSVAKCADLMIKIADFGVKVFVIHASGEPIDEDKRPEYMSQAKKSLKELAEVADRCMVTLAVEDLPRTCLGRTSSDMLELVSADTRLKICFDTNHLLGENINEFIEKVGDKIVTTHISDYDFVNERHWLPGEGDINWTELYSALVKVGYTGQWLYEIGFAAPKSIKRDRDLNCEDFVRNAKEIFDSKPLTNMATRYEKISFWGEPEE